MKVRRVDFSSDEWLAGTIELKGLDRGTYITVCSLIYSRGGPIDEELIFRHMVDHGNAVRASLDRLEQRGKIVRNGSEISQKRCRKELEKAQKRSEKASENGSIGNEIKKLRIATRSGVSIANHQPSTVRKKERESESKMILTCPVALLPDAPPTSDPQATIGPLSPHAEAPAIDPPPNQPGLRALPLSEPKLARAVESNKAKPLEVAITMTRVWNEVCGEISQARAPNPSRARTCAIRWRDEFGSSEDQWRSYCRRIVAAPHLRGENDRGWKVDLDWVLEPRNVSKILEGRYDPRGPVPVARRVNGGGYAGWETTNRTPDYLEWEKRRAAKSTVQ